MRDVTSRSRLDRGGFRPAGGRTAWWLWTLAHLYGQALAVQVIEDDVPRTRGGREAAAAADCERRASPCATPRAADPQAGRRARHRCISVASEPGARCGRGRGREDQRHGKRVGQGALGAQRLAGKASRRRSAARGAPVHCDQDKGLEKTCHEAAVVRADTQSRPRWHRQRGSSIPRRRCARSYGSASVRAAGRRKRASRRSHDR